MTAVDEIFQQVGLSKGAGATVPYIDDNGEFKRVRVWRVLGFGAVREDGRIVDQRVVFHADGNTGKRLAMTASGIRKGVEHERRQEQAQARRAVKMTTDAAARYAVDLAGRLGDWGWQDVDGGWGGPVPSFEDFKARPAHVTSMLIDQMKEELGTVDY